jgi:outer membrane protein OmpA-like peptidoglycan-associated protein
MVRAIFAIVSLAYVLAGCGAANTVNSDSLAAREFATQKIGTCCWIDDRLLSEDGAGSAAIAAMEEAQKEAAAAAVAEQDAKADEALTQRRNAERARQLALAKESEKNQAARLAQALADKGAAELEGIFFDFDKSTLTRESESALLAVQKVLNNDPTLRLEIQGHTDNIGSAEYNRKLSQRRAQAVKNYVVKHFGIAPDRLSARGYGASMPAADNNTEVGRAYNRRVVLIKK